MQLLLIAGEEWTFNVVREAITRISPTGEHHGAPGE